MDGSFRYAASLGVERGAVRAEGPAPAVPARIILAAGLSTLRTSACRRQA